MAEYIDREAAISLIKQYGHDAIDGGRYSLDTVGDCIELANRIETLPAADVAPVVHGWWYGNNCTACKLPWNYCMVQNADDWGYFDPMPDYCPNCGAKMDGGAGDDANGNG